MAKRKIPVKHFLTNEEFQNFIESERDWMYTHIIEAIEKAFFEESEYAEIMEAKISETMSKIVMKSESYEWVTSLKLAMKWYEEEEKYERCGEILKLINGIQEFQKNKK
jgi:hypothetical protein